MTKYATMAPQAKMEGVDVFVETEQGQYIQVEEISGTTPLTTLQTEMLDPLAHELARLIRELIACGEFSVSGNSVVCSKVEVNEIRQGSIGK